MSDFYEDVLLREEFKLVQKLQKEAEFAKYVSVRYEDRVTGETKTVLALPTAEKYPETYVVDYRMPVFVGVGQLRNDYHGTAKITLSKPVLTNKQADHGPFVVWNSNFAPFNNHILQNSICSGNAWVVAKENGLWHFIISLGALINQDAFVCAEASHFNPAAYDYWVLRRRRPITSINWPLDLTLNPPITVIPIDGPIINIVRRTPEQQPVKKIKIIRNENT